MVRFVTHLKLLHANTTPTIFLPMSWTSPFTVAKTITPEYPDSFPKNIYIIPCRRVNFNHENPNILIDLKQYVWFWFLILLYFLKDFNIK